jgi:hypothetical protein
VEIGVQILFIDCAPNLLEDLAALLIRHRRWSGSLACR